MSGLAGIWFLGVDRGLTTESANFDTAFAMVAKKLFDHLVGGSEQFVWHGEAEHPSVQTFFLAQGRLEAL